MQQEMYSVQEAAQKLNVHEKTVLRYIKEGTITAKKVGGKWKIPASEVTVSSEHEPTFQVSASNTDILPMGTINCSTVVDIIVENREDAERLSTMIVAILNGKNQSYGKATYNFVYYPEEKKARHILWGTPRFMSDILLLIEEIER